MKTDFNTSYSKAPAFTALHVRKSALEQAGRRIPIRNLDEAIKQIKAIEQEYKDHPIDIEIFTSCHSNRLFGRIAYEKGNYLKIMFENGLSMFCKNNPIKFIKKCCKDADLTRESFMI